MINNKKITLITNIFLVIIFSFVALIGFIPNNVVSIYGGAPIKAIYNGNRQNKNVSIMINVYENSNIVNSMLNVLDRYNVKATFFVGGCWADDNQNTLQNIVNSGNEIGNHGYFHKDHAKLNYEQNKSEIENCSKIIKSLCGANINLFAPPSGSFSDETLEVASNLNYKVIMWSKDTIDWRDKDENLVYKRATNNISNGDLILMHPKEHTLLALPKILEYYISIGLKIVTVSENIL